MLIVNDFILIFFSHFSSLLYFLMEAKLPIIVHRPLTSVHYSFCGFPQKESNLLFSLHIPLFPSSHIHRFMSGSKPGMLDEELLNSWIFSQPFQVKIHFITLFFKIFLPFAWEKLTEQIMAALGKELGIPADRTYIRYTATTDWGWNGGNF